MPKTTSGVKTSEHKLTVWAFILNAIVVIAHIVAAFMGVELDVSDLLASQGLATGGTGIYALVRGSVKKRMLEEQGDIAEATIHAEDDYR